MTSHGRIPSSLRLAHVPQLRNRWIIAAAGIVMQLALGSANAWSIFQRPLQQEYGWSISQVTAAFSLSIFALGISAFLGGLWMARVGPRAVGTVAGVLNGLGLVAVTFSGHRLWMLYLSYGVVGGVGLGLGYIVPVATLVKWFPDKRGLITGIAVAGFGIGPIVTAPLATRLIRSVHVLPTFGYLGCVQLAVVVLAARFMANPPAGYVPAGWQPSAAQVRQRSTREYTLGEALRHWQWYALWAMLFLNITAGIALLSQAAAMAEDLAGASATAAAGLVSVIAIANGVGRPMWSSLSDLVGRRPVFLVMFVAQAASFLALRQVASFALLACLSCVVLLCYGGGFATMPAFVADYFGSKRVGQIYGLMLSAWGCAAVVGPQMTARLREASGHYTAAFTLLAAIMLASTVLPALIRPPGRTPKDSVGAADRWGVMKAAKG
jgi:OFA family oxalate/formate antiporter-like MFS transporter